MNENWKNRKATGPYLTDAFIHAAVKSGSIVPPRDGIEHSSFYFIMSFCVSMVLVIIILASMFRGWL